MNTKMLIGGKLVDGAGKLDVVNPATGRSFVQAERADEAQLELAVSSAKQAFPAWAACGWEERAGYVSRLADGLEEVKDDLARLLTMEQGKPLNQAKGEIAAGIQEMRHVAGQRIEPVVLREDARTRIIEHRTPLGVVAAITPWNFPFLMVTQKIGPALMAGNTVVAKPAPTTPMIALAIAAVAADVLPAGVLNVIVDDNDLGAKLSGHRDVAKVTFTGSTVTGRKVGAAGADTLKRITLELGGNDAAIVLDDVRVADVAPSIFRAATMNAGQVCLATKRVYAPAPLYDELCDALAKLASEAVVDDGDKQGTQIGPIQNRMQYEKLLGYLDDAKANGTVIAGGHPLEREGYFIAPTIVRDIPDDAALVREEQFGPVLPVLKYDDIDDAIARANDSEYGLGGIVWAGDTQRGVEVAMKINTGTVWVNKGVEIPSDIPFGGAKQSGIGRKGGDEGLEAFTQPHIVNVALG
ncbi:aldehyde dehydrogenase family protein [Paraurantiacibacter namhicola]|uniref:Succinate-semialdehyde dehydrogenase [NADP(+)] GabD n=1 Tax=Paraurantiacibacter namhicola TaxID=645517 RepID=A0A1C7DA83_9SPHN|nr:aldehyde dehydrogenase family protein [Paraurantiacibacter namhicola]ANU08409.1 Succinate-semialdehyde dehydrogenase [NADP(+)] GabD [Paraurantiacibacter namhicola]